VIHVFLGSVFLSVLRGFEHLPPEPEIALKGVEGYEELAEAQLSN
jgi:hypothetical protein